MNKLNVGVIGCGVISEIYMENCTKKFRNLKLVACADILYESALRRAKQFGCKAESIEELLGDPEVEVVLNLTPPASHFNISMKILKAGKHVYTEKPMAANKTECELLLKFAKENNLYIGNAPDCFLGAGLQTCRRLLESGAIGTPFAVLKAGKHVYTEKPMAANKTECELLLKFAKENNLYIGNAPDCFLGAGLQTCRRLLESGAIGTPFAAQAFMFSFGPENFHPNPSFFYQHGAGPLLDWGPYYISALVALMGPIRKVIALGRSPFHERCVLSTDSPHFGENFPVEVPTYVTSLLEFENDFIATLSISFDMKYPYWESNMPFIRIFGTEGSLDVPDVNQYGGPVIIRDKKGSEKDIGLINNHFDNNRGVGLSDMAYAIQTGNSFRANGDFGLHVTEVLVDIQEAINTGKPIEVKNRCKKPDLVTSKLTSCLYG